MAERFEEGTVTILFTDVERSTDLGNAAGDISAREIMRAHDEIIRTAVQEHSGREIKSLGDGFMIGFTSARRAVSCAVAIQRALHAARRDKPHQVPAVRIGLNAGEVVHDDDDMFGTSVAAAARITARAKGGQILASSVVKALVGTLPEIEFRDAGNHRLKGFDEEWHLLEVTWVGDPVMHRARNRTPFVGRDQERSELRRLVDGLAEGKGSLALIGGEPGVGKTRLAEEIAQEAKKEGHRILVGRCHDVDAPTPYLPFVELLEAAAHDVDRETFRMALGEAAGEIAKVMPQLRSLYDDIPPGLDLPSEQERRYLFNSIGEFVERAAAVTPVVVILDDLQWADQPSLALLESIARRLERMPVVIIGTYRNVELDLHRPLSKTLDHLLRQRLAERITLKRMSEKGVEAMLTRLAGSAPPPELVTIIFKETDGNAFFVEELFRHLCEENGLLDDEGRWREGIHLGEIDVPEGVRLVIGRRLERLDETALKILTVAAVLGRTFDYELLAATSDSDEDTLLDAIEDAQKLTLISPLGSVPSETRYEFVHELIRQTLISGISLPRRQRLHLRVATAMEKLYDASLAERAADVLNHLYQAGAGTSDQAIRLLLLAGTRAQESAAFEDSLRYFEEAMTLIDPNERSLKAHALVGLGHAQRSLSRVDEAVSNWSEALTIFDELGDIDSLGEVGRHMVMQLGWAGRWEELVQIAGRVLGVLGQEPTPERALLLAFGAIGLGWAGFYDAAKPMLDEALEIAESLGEDEILGQIYAVDSSLHYAYGRLTESIEVGDRAIERLKRTGAQWDYVTALAFVNMSRAFTARIEGLEKPIREQERLAERLGFGGGLMLATRARFGLAMTGPQSLDDYERLAQRDYDICVEYELPWTPQSHVFIGRARFLQGRLDEALEHGRIGKETDPPSVLYGFGLGTQFTLSAYANQRDEAMELWEEIKLILPEAGVSNPFGRQCLVDYAVEGLFALGEDALAGSLHDVLVDTWTGVPMRFSGQLIETIAGIAATAAKRWDEAEDHFEKALATAEETGLTLAGLEAERFYGTMLLRRGGDEERARSHLNAALEGFRQIGMPFHQRLVEELLGVSTPSLERS